jgi:hypothetical protein
MNNSVRSLQLEGAVEVKSKFDAEFRRFSLEKSKYHTFDSFRTYLCELHHLQKIPFFIKYADPKVSLIKRECVSYYPFFSFLWLTVPSK